MKTKYTPLLQSVLSIIIFTITSLIIGKYFDGKPFQWEMIPAFTIWILSLSFSILPPCSWKDGGSGGPCMFD